MSFIDAVVALGLAGITGWSYSDERLKVLLIRKNPKDSFLIAVLFYGKDFSRRAVILSCYLGTIYLCVRLLQIDPKLPHVLGLPIAMLIVVMCYFIAIPLFPFIYSMGDFFGLLVQGPERTAQPVDKPSDIFTTGHPATLAQLNAAARSGTSSDAPPLRFKD